MSRLLAKSWVAYVVASAWTVYLLFSLLKTGYISDDAYLSMTPGLLIEKDAPLWRYWIEENSTWMFENGRFFPLALYTTFLFVWIRSLLIFKCITLAIILSNIWIFGALIKKLTRSTEAAFLTMLAVPIFFQFRAWHDPILAFHFLLPLTALWLFSSLYFFQAAIDDPGSGRTKKITSILLYIGALFTYEITYPSFVLYILLAWNYHESLKRALFSTLPFTLSSLATIALSIALKIPAINPLASHAYSGSLPVFNAKGFFNALEIQFAAGLPFSYYLRAKLPFWRSLHAADYVAAAAIAALIFALLRRTSKNSPRLTIPIALFAAAVAAVPAGIIAISGHQIELLEVGHGLGYLPVYLQYFGTWFLISIPLFKALGRLRAPVSSLISGSAALLLAAAGLVHLGSNRSVVHDTHPTYLYPWRTLNRALQHQLLNEVPEGATLIRNWRFPSDFSWMYSTATRKTFDAWFVHQFYPEYVRRKYFTPKTPDWVTNWLSRDTCRVTSQLSDWFDGTSPEHLPELPQQVVEDDLSSSQIYLVTYQFDRESGRSGTVFLGKLDRLIHNPRIGALYQYRVNELLIYDLETQSLVRRQGLVDFNRLFDESGAPPKPIQALDIGEFSPREYAVSWAKGCRELEGTSEANVRWCGKAATLLLYNPTYSSLQLDLSMGISTGDAQAASTRITYDGKIETSTTSPNPAPYSKSVRLRPHQEASIQIETDAKRFAPTDYRELYFGIHTFKINVKKTP